MAIVFQYGSNCLSTELNSGKRLRGDAQFITIAETVHHYELAFDVWSKNRRCAACDIRPKAGSRVWGVIYDVPDWLIARDTASARGRKALDAIEGEGTNYCREIIPVRTSEGVTQAVTYTVIAPREGLRTNSAYV